MVTDWRARRWCGRLVEWPAYTHWMSRGRAHWSGPDASNSWGFKKHLQPLIQCSDYRPGRIFTSHPPYLLLDMKSSNEANRQGRPIPPRLSWVGRGLPHINDPSCTITDSLHCPSEHPAVHTISLIGSWASHSDGDKAYPRNQKGWMCQCVSKRLRFEPPKTKAPLLAKKFYLLSDNESDKMLFVKLHNQSKATIKLMKRFSILTKPAPEANPWYF